MQRKKCQRGTPRWRDRHCDRATLKRLARRVRVRGSPRWHHLPIPQEDGTSQRAMKMRLCNAGGLLVFKRRRQMERIDLFVRVMSLKKTGPLLFLEDLSKEGSDSRHTRRLMTPLGWTPGTHRLEGKKKTDFSKLSLDLHMCTQRQRHTASPCGINRCIRRKKKMQDHNSFHS